MKIKLSKSQWEAMGKQAGWMKTAQSNDGMTINAIFQKFPDIDRTYKAASGNMRLLKKLLDQANINWKRYPEFVELFGL